MWSGDELTACLLNPVYTIQPVVNTVASCKRGFLLNLARLSLHRSSNFCESDSITLIREFTVHLLLLSVDRFAPALLAWKFICGHNQLACEFDIRPHRRRTHTGIYCAEASSLDA